MQRTRKAIKDAKILIGGVTRNCETTLRDTLAALNEATGNFQSRAVYIVESDSDDGTVAELESLKQEGVLDYASLGSLAGKYPLRTERIAFCRNHFLEFVLNSSEEYDYILLADMDGLNTGVTRKAIEDGWNRPDIWDVIAANQFEGYYDVWALRHRHWMPDDCWKSAEALEPYFGVAKSRELAVHSRQASLQLSASLLEVDSAFGGLAIYRREAFVSGRYTGIEGGKQICEHVPFHRMLRERGFRIFINPQLINASPVAHLTSVHWTYRAKNELFYALRRIKVALFPKPQPAEAERDTGGRA